MISKGQALVRLQDLCARGEHSQGEIYEKLHKWGLSQADATAVVTRLVSERYVDDERFAHAYARDKMRFSHWGRRKIALGLMQKRVARDIANAAIDELDQEEYDHILDMLLAARLKNQPAALDDYQQRAKIFRFLMSRGFESGEITCSFRRRLESPDR